MIGHQTLNPRTSEPSARKRAGGARSLRVPVNRRGKGLTTQAYRVLIALLISTNGWLLTACSTGTKIETNEAQSLNYIRFVINQTAPRGVRSASVNQREVFSNYFTSASFNEDGTNRSYRSYAHFFILGASRPYTVEVRVVNEFKKGSSYKTEGTDKKRSAVLAKRLTEALAKSREDSNFVDDWRPF